MATTRLGLLGVPWRPYAAFVAKTGAGGIGTTTGHMEIRPRLSGGLGVSPRLSGIMEIKPRTSGATTQRQL